MLISGHIDSDNLSEVPILAGAPPPGYPGEKPVDGSDDDMVLWEKAARIFVQ